MSFHEFAQPLYVDTPLGRGVALFVETNPHEAFWTVALTETRALVCFKQSKIRIGKSYTDCRGVTDEEMLDRIKL